jgi:pimeloyl-ACP methyl ester carboxylesterase
MTARSTHLVLVPGLSCTEDLFAEQIASMRGEVIISVADHARHDTMSAIARAVLATAPDRFALCGLSVGGAIAFEMVRQAPDRIERLALLDTSALTDTPEQTERRLKLIAMAQTGEFKLVRDTLWPLFVHPARHDNVALKRAVFKMMDDTGPETSVSRERSCRGPIRDRHWERSIVQRLCWWAMRMR